MKDSLKTDTLAFQLARPGMTCRDLSAIPLQLVAAQCAAFRKSSSVGEYLGDTLSEPSRGDPQTDAIMFYMSNHAVSVIRSKVHPLQPLGPLKPIMEDYAYTLGVMVPRMFFYLLLICTRESRHVKNDHGSSFVTTMTQKYGPDYWSWTNTLRGQSSQGAAESFLTKPPNLKLGKYVCFLADLFNQGHFSSAFGGPAWGKIAELLRDFVIGKLTPEMMLDTAFTLAHNTAPIFNKGMLYSDWNSELYKILDIQRSGQIPKYVSSEKKHTQGHGWPRLLKFYETCAELMPSEFVGYVDYFAVEELGATKSYPQEKALQVQKYGAPAKFKAKQTLEMLKAQQAADQAAQEAKQYVTLHPGCKVKILESERA